MKRESKPHGSKDFEYHPHKVDDLDHFRSEYDRIFKKGIHATDPVPFQAGDHVKHASSGEEWILAVDEENGRVQPCGWPNTMAQASDCTLIQPASPQERIDMLMTWASTGKGAEHERDSRTRAARHQLPADDPVHSLTPGTVREYRSDCCCEPVVFGDGRYVCNACYNPCNPTMTKINP